MMASRETRVNLVQRVSDVPLDLLSHHMLYLPAGTAAALMRLMYHAEQGCLRQLAVCVCVSPCAAFFAGPTGPVGEFYQTSVLPKWLYVTHSAPDLQHNNINNNSNIKNTQCAA